MSENDEQFDTAPMMEPYSMRPVLPKPMGRHWRIGFTVLFIALILSAIHVSSYNAILALVASSQLRLDQNQESLLNSSDFELQQKRLVQQHFLKYGIYIPIDDITVKDVGIEADSYQLMLQQSCGSGKLFVWVPLKFRLPLIGEKILEWCLVKK